MRGEEEAVALFIHSAQTEFTVGCLDARRGRHAMDCHQLKPARLACMGIDGAATLWECAVRGKQLISTRYTRTGGG